MSVNLETVDNNEKTGSGIKWLLLVLLLVLTAAAAFYLFGVSSNKSAEEHVAVVKETSKKVEVPEVAATAASGTVDTSGNYIYDLGKIISIELPNGAGTLKVGENSTESRLYKFLSDASATIDTVKGNWFEFTNVRFVTGSAKVDSASSIQLINIVALSKGFPAASFKLGGYTDNTGDSVANVVLSQKRSEAVLAALKKLGISSKALTGAKGYGPQFPIGDNATALGRAMNRRVAINVKSK
jgi:outer membrane protein OmpA-like peptidoglycan-associated protein